MKKSLLVLVSLLLLGSNIGNARSWMYFYSRYSYVAPTSGGFTSFSSDTGSFFEEVNSAIGFMSFVINTADHEVWNIEFATPDGSDFRLYYRDGVTYDGAQRSPFQEPGHPGLSLTGDGRGYNQLSGWFDIYDFSRGEDGRVEHARVHFYQHGEDFSDGRDTYEFGWINYEASVVPEPGTIAIASIGVFGLVLFRRK